MALVKKKIKSVDKIIAGLDTMLHELRSTADAQDQLQHQLESEIALLTSEKEASVQQQNRARRIAANLDAIVNPTDV